VDNLQETLANLPSSLFIETGEDCIDADKLNWKVTIISSACEYAVMCSMSHTIGDGYTFFKIKDMISTSCTDICSMSFGGNEHILEQVNIPTVNVFPVALKPALTVACKYFFPRLWSFLYPCSLSTTIVDEKWISEEKKKYDTIMSASGSKAHYSTNDVLVNAALGPGEYALVPVNLRFIARGNHMERAGNISCIVSVYPEQHSGVKLVNTQRQIMNLHKSSQLRDHIIEEPAGEESVPVIVTNLSEYYTKSTLPNSTFKTLVPVIPKDSVFMCGVVIIIRDDGENIVSVSIR